MKNSKTILKIIRYIAVIFVALAVVAEGYLFVVRPGDDIAGGVFMGLLTIAFSGTVAIVIKKFEKNHANNN